MAAMRFEQVQRFILAKKIFWGYGHFKQEPIQRRFDFSGVLYFGWPNQPSSTLGTKGFSRVVRPKTRAAKKLRVI